MPPRLDLTLGVGADITSAASSLRRLEAQTRETAARIARQSGGAAVSPAERAALQSQLRAQQIEQRAQRQMVAQQRLLTQHNRLGQQTQQQAQPSFLERTARQLERETPAERILGAVSDRTQRVGRGLTAGVTAPAIGLGGFAISQAIGRESAFAGVRKTVTTAEDQFVDLHNRLRAEAKATGISYEELAKKMEIGGQMGIGVPHLGDFTRVLAETEVSTNLQGEEGALLLGRIIKLSGSAQSEARNVASTIVALGNTFETQEKPIAEMWERAAAAMTGAGLKSGEQGGIIAAFAAAGMNPEAGGSALSRIFATMQEGVTGGGDPVDNSKKIREMQDRLEDQRDELRRANLQGEELKAGASRSQIQANWDRKDRLQREIGQAEKDLAELQAGHGKPKGGSMSAIFAKVAGMDEGAFKELFKSDPAEAFTRFVEGIDKLPEGAVFDILRKLDLDDIRITQGLRSTAQAGDLRRAVDTGRTAFSEGTALGKESGERFGTTENQMRMAREEVNDSFAELGKEALPVLKEALPLVTQFTQLMAQLNAHYKALSPAQQDFVKTSAGLLVTVGPALVLFGSLASGLSSIIGLFRLLGPVVVPLAKFCATGLGTFAVGIKAALVAIGPLGWAILGIGAALLLLKTAWDKNWGDIQGKTATVVEAIKSAFGGIHQTVLSIFEKVRTTVTDWFVHLAQTPVIGGAFQPIATFLQSQKSLLPNAGPDFAAADKAAAQTDLIRRQPGGGATVILQGPLMDIHDVEVNASDPVDVEEFWRTGATSATLALQAVAAQGGGTPLGLSNG